MLVLSRNLGQEVVIGEGITVKVLEVTGNRVRLGVVAPVEIPIRRAAVCRAMEVSRLQCR